MFTPSVDGTDLRHLPVRVSPAYFNNRVSNSLAWFRADVTVILTRATCNVVSGELIAKLVIDPLSSHAFLEMFF